MSPTNPRLAGTLPHQSSADTLSSPPDVPHPPPSLRHPLWSALFAKLSQKSVIDHWKASLPALPGSAADSPPVTARNSIVSALVRVESSQVSEDTTHAPFERDSSVAAFELALLAQR
ncbi:hypothetical protein HDU83_004553 [Entophlyctis luteolus]|nr:hypothetical protein HDU83_004553 [Entophlyctis luteolus]KAJ3382710.1 hypothetical protein HDU84_004097 [Entophlyctis sp. JEL0112]